MRNLHQQWRGPVDMWPTLLTKINDTDHAALIADSRALEMMVFLYLFDQIPHRIQHVVIQTQPRSPSPRESCVDRTAPRSPTRSLILVSLPLRARMGCICMTGFACWDAGLLPDFKVPSEYIKQLTHCALRSFLLTCTSTCKVALGFALRMITQNVI